MNSIDDIIGFYSQVIKSLDDDAKNISDRAYGGYLRAQKGILHERITESLIRLAWYELDGDPEDIEINKKKIKIPIKQDYIDNIENSDIKNYINENMGQHSYKLSVDKQVCIRGEFVLGIECKAYTENAMLKRICVDFHFLKKLYPHILCYLVQLESQLGGDYSELGETTYGSPSTHTILSYFSLNLKIITLLEGERKIDRPIHKFYKPLEKRNLERALQTLKGDLGKFSRVSRV